MTNISEEIKCRVEDLEFTKKSADSKISEDAYILCITQPIKCSATQIIKKNRVG